MSGVVVVVGNPSPASRTRAAAALVGDRVARHVGVDRAPTVIDLAGSAPALVAWGDPEVARLVQVVQDADALVVASPTYKASFTGLVKLFLDRFDHDALGGTVTVPMMTGGSPAHSLAVEHHLRPVLVEIGASCPTRGLYLAGDEIDEPAPAIDRWEELAGPVLARASAR